jgi:hypothetical protein
MCNNSIIQYFTYYTWIRWSRSDKTQSTHLKKTSYILEIIMKSYEICYILYTIIIYAIAWSYASQLANWLNRMNELDRNMSRLCSEFWFQEIQEFSRLVWLYVVFYVGLSSLVIGSGVLVYAADWNHPGYMVPVLVCSFVQQMCMLSLDAVFILCVIPPYYVFIM